MSGSSVFILTLPNSEYFNINPKPETLTFNEYFNLTTIAKYSLALLTSFSSYDIFTLTALESYSGNTTLFSLYLDDAQDLNSGIDSKNRITIYNYYSGIPIITYVSASLVSFSGSTIEDFGLLFVG